MKNAKNSPSKGEKNKNFKELTIKRVIFCPFHSKKNPKKVKKVKIGKNWRVNIAKNSPLKGKNCKKFTLNGKKCKEFKLKGRKLKRIHP